MADTKLSALTEDTSPTGDDLIYIVNDPGGTPGSRRVTINNFIYNLIPYVHTSVSIPSVNEDGANTGGVGVNFKVGDYWVETTGERTAYMCLNAATGAAQWEQIVDATALQTLTNKTLSSAALTGDVDLSGADSITLIADSAPTVDANGEIAIDTTITDFSHGLIKYHSGEELVVVAMPVSEIVTPVDGHYVAYNATNDEFELVAPAGGSHISSGAGAPSSTPGGLGYVYVDTTNNIIYSAVDTTGSSDWIKTTELSSGSPIGSLTALTAATIATDDDFVLGDTSDTDNAKRVTASELVKYVRTGIPIVGVAVSDETTDLTTGTAKATFRAPFAFTLTEVRASVNTAPVGSTIAIDLNESGTSVFSTTLTIDASEKTSESAAAAAVISDSSIADDAELTIDIDQVGSTTAGKGLKVVLYGTPA